jgi:serine/threonine-protein kinase HipA
LRNHGFILTDKGWTLSPAYDVNSNEDGTGLSLNITLENNSLDLELPLEVIDYFRLDQAAALKIIDEIRTSVSKWRTIANKHKLLRSEQELMAKVFEKLL